MRRDRGPPRLRGGRATVDRVAPYARHLRHVRGTALAALGLVIDWNTHPGMFREVRRGKLVFTTLAAWQARTAGIESLVGLGATEVHWDRRPPDADYVILADPEGNRFCVVDASDQPRDTP